MSTRDEHCHWCENAPTGRAHVAHTPVTALVPCCDEHTRFVSAFYPYTDDES